MYQPEEDFDFNKSLEKFNDGRVNQNPNRNYDDEKLSLERIKTRKQQLERIFIKLIVFGLGVGLILGFGVFILLNKLGLTKKPYEIEREKRQQPATEEVQTYQLLGPEDKMS